MVFGLPFSLYWPQSWYVRPFRILSCHLCSMSGLAVTPWVRKSPMPEDAGRRSCIPSGSVRQLGESRPCVPRRWIKQEASLLSPPIPRSCNHPYWVVCQLRLPECMLPGQLPISGGVVVVQYSRRGPPFSYSSYEIVARILTTPCQCTYSPRSLPVREILYRRWVGGMPAKTQSYCTATQGRMPNVHRWTINSCTVIFLEGRLSSPLICLIA